MQRNRRFVAWTLLLSLFVFSPGYAGSSVEQTNLFESSANNRFYPTDQPDWENPSIQSDDWPSFHRQLSGHEYIGIYWLSFDVYLKSGALPAFDYVYNLHMLAAQEVYWDDVYLGNNGVPAVLKADEVPGEVWTTYLVPNDLLTPGKHELKIRASSHYRHTNMGVLIEGWIGPFDPTFRYVSLGSLIPSLFVSVSIVVGLYFLMLFFTEGRQLEHLLFFLLLQSLAVFGFAIQWPHLVGYSYDLEVVNMLLQAVSGLSMLILMPLYFLVKHRASYIWTWLLGASALTILLMTLLEIPDLTLAAFVSFCTALLASIYYGLQRKRHLWWESLGLLVCLYGVVNQDLEDVYLYFPSLFSLVLLTHALSMQRRKAALQQAFLLESQLRGELLRKHIQPHFLLNTLTSLIEWVETDAERGTEFIVALAEEFRLMSNMSSQALVPMDTEIQLCEKHLDIMSFRLQKQCTLHCDAVEGNDPIPPAIFHTLVENAFSHNAYEGEELRFHLSKEVLANGRVCFRFSAPRAMRISSAFAKTGAGTGRKYIEARLNQSFGKYWSYREVQERAYWSTEIEVDYRHLKRTVISMEPV